MGQRMIQIKFSKKKSAKRELTRIQKRIQLLSNEDLLAWAETSIYDIARNISSWKKQKNGFYLDEAKLAAEVLFEALEVVHRRENVK